MTSIAIRELGGPDMLVAREQPLPAPGDGEILVKVAAAGVNRPDVMRRQGHYPPPKGATEIPGLEIAGEIVRIGRGVSRWQIGDQVMALVVGDRKSTRLNSSHPSISYAVFCLKKKNRGSPRKPGIPPAGEP